VEYTIALNLTQALYLSQSLELRIEALDARLRKSPNGRNRYQVTEELNALRDLHEQAKTIERTHFERVTALLTKGKD
jgi:hypothetical protein